MPRPWILAPALVTLRKQINEANPNRDKESDGTIGDADHATRASDHNPWVTFTDHRGVTIGVVTAIDIDEDLSPTVRSAESLVKALQASEDPRIKYIIYEKRITVKDDITRWKTYSGKNPHDKHFHLSVRSERKYWDDGSLWNLGQTLAPAPPVAVTYREGDKGAGVKEVQQRLILYKFLAPNGADGHFGKKTKEAVIGFQRNNGLTPDGIVGANTRQKLFN